MFKLLSKKKLLIIISIIFLLFIFKDTIEMLTFDIYEEDLIANEAFNYEQVVKNTLAIFNLKFNFMQGIGVVIPIIALIVSYEFEQIKKKVLIYNIGKNSEYNKEKNKLKLKLALVSVVPIIFTYTFMTIISVLGLNGFVGGGVGDSMILEGSLLSKIITNDLGYYIFVLISVVISCALVSLLSINIVDNIGYLKGALALLGYVWIFSILLYMVPNSLIRSIVPMESIMGIVKMNYSIKEFILEKTLVILPILGLYKIKKDEV